METTLIIKWQAEANDTLAGLQQKTGRDWHETNFNRDPTTLEIGETVSYKNTKPVNNDNGISKIVSNFFSLFKKKENENARMQLQKGCMLNPKNLIAIMIIESGIKTVKLVVHIFICFKK